MPTRSAKAKLFELNIPMLALSGDHDIVFPIANWYEQTRVNPNLQVIMLPQARPWTSKPVSGADCKLYSRFYKQLTDFESENRQLAAAGNQQKATRYCYPVALPIN